MTCRAQHLGRYLEGQGHSMTLQHNRVRSIISLLYPHHKMWGGGLYWIRVVASVGPSVGRSVSNSCPLYNSFTNGRISFKLE